MKGFIKISLGVIVSLLIINSSHAVMLYDTLIDKKSKVEIISDNDCIKVGIYTTKYSYEPNSFTYGLGISSKCKDVYIYLHEGIKTLLINKELYDRYSYIKNDRTDLMFNPFLKENNIEYLKEEKNIVGMIYDSTVHYDIGEFTRKLVNINDENDVILIKGKINRDLKAKIKVLLIKYYIIFFVGIFILLIIIIYKRKFLIKLTKGMNKNK